jgi:hypothetical protein
MHDGDRPTAAILDTAGSSTKDFVDIEFICIIKVAMATERAANCTGRDGTHEVLRAGEFQ